MNQSPTTTLVTITAGKQALIAGFALTLCLCVNLAYATTELKVSTDKPVAEVPAAEAVVAVPAAEAAAAATEAPAEVEAATPPGADSSTGPAASEPTTEPASAAPGLGSTTAEETPEEPPADSEGMQIPVVGTSLEAFDASLADIQTKTTAAEYTTLQNAIDYLLVYNLSARRDRTKLAAILNGKTGVEIVDMVTWQRAPKKKPSAPQTEATPEEATAPPATPDGQ